MENSLAIHVIVIRLFMREELTIVRHNLRVSTSVLISRSADVQYVLSRCFGFSTRITDLGVGVISARDVHA